ncbi:MAG: hypothetical protein L3J52_02125 [Proteobacteria bacterium]|nr:hypothetical protein [Pseudomonadota bacterium]
MNLFKYFFREIKNVFEFYLIPIVVVIFPHKIYYSFFKFICSYTFFYSVYSKDSYECAIDKLDQVNNQKTWTRNVRLLYLMDIADSWLAWLRPKKSSRILVKEANWKKDSGFIALSAHWGTGFISLVDLKNSNHNPFFVFSADPVSFKDQGLVEKIYRKIRRRYVNKISGSTAIPTGGSYKNIKNKLESNGVPVILFDAPKYARATKFSLKILNYKYNVSSGFINLICQEKIPYQLFSVKLDFDTGIRKLRIDNAINTTSEQRLINELSSFLDLLITESPEHWYFWRQSNKLFIEETNKN